MTTVKLAVNAMATRFEVVLPGEDQVALRAAGEEALGEIERLEGQLSLFRPESEIAQLNARAAFEPIQVTRELFDLLVRATTLHDETGGAFDITIAPLVRCWGFMGGTGRLPSPEELERARGAVGMRLVELDPGRLTVRFARQGVMLDLGAIGKGYAVEQAAEVLREAGVTSALLHGGTSTVYGLGSPPEAESWSVAIDQPKGAGPRWGSLVPDRNPTAAVMAGGTSGESSSEAVSQVRVPLKDEAISVSAVWGRSFEAEGKTYGHVLDPRTGRSVSGSLLAAVVLPSATETDALSTALLIRGEEFRAELSARRPGIRSVFVAESG